MMSIDHQLQQRIDQLLMETGEYSPLELLLAEGRLLYSDYEAWINGDIECLEDTLFGDPEHIRTMLQQARDYASKLPMLQAQPFTASSQQTSLSTRLFSRNPQTNNLFNTVYRKATDQPQMDMFVDGGTGNLINGITLALSQGDFAEARRLLEQLYDVQPDNAKLNDLEILVQFAEQPLGVNRDIAGELDFMQNHLTALAQAHLAQRAREYLIPQWRRLTTKLSDHVFDPAQPNLHASFTGIQALDWSSVKQAIEQESQWRKSPVLLARHAQACTRLWLPAQVDSDLKNAWMDFLELEPELAVSTFPAWHLLHKPGLINTLPEHQEDTPWDELYQAVYRKLKAQPSGNSTYDIDLRQQLQEINPVFFQHFIKSV